MTMIRYYYKVRSEYVISAIYHHLGLNNLCSVTPRMLSLVSALNYKQSLMNYLLSGVTTPFGKVTEWALSMIPYFRMRI